MCMPPFKTSAPAQTHDRFLHKRGPDAAGLESEPFSLPPPNTPPPRPLPTLSDGEFLNIGDDEDIKDGGVDLGNPSPRSVLKTKTTSDDDGSSNASSSRNLNIIPAPLQEAVAAPPSPIPTMASMQTWLESIPIAIPPSQASDPDPSSDSSSGDSSSSSSSDDDDDDEEEDSYMEKEIVAWRPEPLPAGREGGGKGKRAGFAASLHHLQVQTLEGSRGECIFSAGSPLSPFHYQNHLRPLSGLLEACFFCNSSFSPGKDIYMYRGDRAFCSMECRYEQIIIDERNEICPKSSKN